MYELHVAAVVVGAFVAFLLATRFWWLHSDAATMRPPSTSTIVWTYVLVFVVPPVGVIGGIYLWRWNKQSGHGIACIALGAITCYQLFFVPLT